MPPSYEKLATDDGEESRLEQKHTSNRLRLEALLVIAAFIFGAAFSSALSWSRGSQSVNDLLRPPGEQLKVMHYNKTFAQPPSEFVDEAWSSIFPMGRGFVHDAELAPNISGFAVFHQLHCLNALRISLHQGEHDSSHKKEGTDKTNSSRRHHVGHCIDYLRQSLMCHADTNLEPIDWKIGGVTGWGEPKSCRNYQAVVDWANQHRTHNQTDIH